MTSSALVHCSRIDSIPRLESGAWRDDLLRLHQGGARVVTCFGRRQNDQVELIAVLCDVGGALRLTRTTTPLALGYHALTSDLPALACFEREIHEQTGLRIEGHPWLKPIRYEGREQRDMSAYPFYQIEGKEVHEVAVGPIHAGVIEPGSFRFMCLGEQVHHLEVQLGYQHRGAEAELLRRDPRSLTPLVETLAGDTSVAHAWASCAALEALSETQLDVEADLARALGLELERVAMHLAGLAGLSADLGFLQGASSYGRLRTAAINTSMRLCGSRFGRGWIRPGGTALRPVDDALRTDVQRDLELLRRDLEIVNDCFLSATTVRHRLEGVGVLATEQARPLGVVGMAARASNIQLDLRQRGVGAFGSMPIECCVLEGGDCWARARIRIEELRASLEWLQRTFALHCPWERAPKPLPDLVPGQLAVALVEGWRGEVVHCLQTDARGQLSHYKVQDPSLRNWIGLAIAVRDNEISDFPICNKSFDLSYCGNDL